MRKRFRIHPVAAGLLLILATNCVRTPRMEILSYTAEQETASVAGCPLTHKLDISLEYPEVMGDKGLSATLIRQSIFEAAFGQSYDTLKPMTSPRSSRNSVRRCGAAGRRPA